MKMPFACAVVACGISGAQDLAHVMQVVRQHVERLETSAPNFICDEQIVSQSFVGRKRKKETRAEAVLTTTRAVKHHRGTFSETRSEMKINGKPTKRNQISGPFVWENGPSYGDLHFLFNSELGKACLEKRLIGPVKLGDKDALLIETRTTNAPARNEACSEMRSDSAHRVWLDPESLNVMRIENLNPPASNLPEGADLTLTVDYAPVVFDGDEYWLPSHLLSVLDFAPAPQHLQYEATFRNYHKFTAESVVHVDPQ